MSGPTCSYCGKQIEPGQLYCPTCGTAVLAPPVIPVEPATTPVPAPEPVEGMRLGTLQVCVSDGVVDLSGGGDQGTLRLAEILARSVPGVLDVRRLQD